MLQFSNFRLWFHGFIPKSIACRGCKWSRRPLLSKWLLVSDLVSRVAWNTYIVIFMKPPNGKRGHAGCGWGWVAAGTGWSRFRKLQPLLQLGSNEIKSGSGTATVANEIYMKQRIRMASSHSGAFAKTWFFRKKKKEMEKWWAGFADFILETETSHLIFLLIVKFWNRKGGGCRQNKIEKIRTRSGICLLTVTE
jgi:hypothetical protein